MEEHYKVGYRVMIDREINYYLEKYVGSDRTGAYVTRESLETLRRILKAGIV